MSATLSVRLGEGSLFWAKLQLFHAIQTDSGTNKLSSLCLDATESHISSSRSSLRTH